MRLCFVQIRLIKVGGFAPQKIWRKRAREIAITAFPWQAVISANPEHCMATDKKAAEASSQKKQALALALRRNLSRRKAKEKPKMTTATSQEKAGSLTTPRRLHNDSG